jgi:hypothetical protein
MSHDADDLLWHAYVTAALAAGPGQGTPLPLWRQASLAHREQENGHLEAPGVIDFRITRHLPHSNHATNDDSRRNLLSQHFYKGCPCQMIRTYRPAGRGFIPRQMGWSDNNPSSCAAEAPGLRQKRTFTPKVTMYKYTEQATIHRPYPGLLSGPPTPQITARRPAVLAPVHVSQRARLQLADLDDMRVIRAIGRLNGALGHAGMSAVRRDPRLTLTVAGDRHQQTRPRCPVPCAARPFRASGDPGRLGGRAVPRSPPPGPAAERPGSWRPPAAVAMARRRRHAGPGWPAA